MSAKVAFRSLFGFLLVVTPEEGISRGLQAALRACEQPCVCEWMSRGNLEAIKPAWCVSGTAVIVSHMSQFPSQTERPHRNLPVNLLPVDNRVREFMEHSRRYAFMGETRLAKDCGVSVAAICRMLVGYGSPSFAMVTKITAAFEKEFGRSIDPREIASIDGDYPTGKVCDVVGCKGCTPQKAWNADDTLKPEYAEAIRQRRGEVQ